MLRSDVKQPGSTALRLSVLLVAERVMLMGDSERPLTET